MAQAEDPVVVVLAVLLWIVITFSVTLGVAMLWFGLRTKLRLRKVQPKRPGYLFDQDRHA